MMTVRWVCGFALWCMSTTIVSAAVPDDAFIAGYAAAVVERDFRVPRASVQVRDGVIRIDSGYLAGVDQQQLLNALRSIPGAVHVELQSPGQFLTATPTEQRPSAFVHQPGQTVVVEASSPGAHFLPQGYLFDQLSADPRWPHFSLSYRYYMGDDELGSTSAANFGETFALYRDRGPFGGAWELGLQAGVFSLFDLTAESKDLINADYFVGGFTSYRYNNLSSILRVFHQSSHLGDEFLLRNRVRRINLSYEQVDLKLSYKFFNALRLYGGGGYLFNQEPSDLAPWTTQYGVEVESPWRFANRAVTPIVAGNFTNDEESNWSTNISLRGGVQFEHWKLGQRRLQLLIEYFHGYSPNGQFYNRKIETIGVGAHLRF